MKSAQLLKVFRAQCFGLKFASDRFGKWTFLGRYFVFKSQPVLTRFGENSPLWQNFKSLLLFFEGLFCYGQNFEPNWSNFMIFDIF